MQSSALRNTALQPTPFASELTCTEITSVALLRALADELEEAAEPGEAQP